MEGESRAISSVVRHMMEEHMGKGSCLEAGAQSIIMHKMMEMQEMPRLLTT